MRNRSIWRRTVLGSMALLAVVIGLSACGSSAKSASSTSQSHGKITLGFIGPLSGGLVQVSTDAIRGAQTAINEINATGGVRGGEKLALKSANEPADPTGSVTAMRNFGSEGVPIVLGDELTPDCDATAPVAQSLGIVDISPGCAGGNLTGPNREFPDFFSSAGSDSAQAYALGHILPARYPKVTNLYVIGYDYLPGTQTASYVESTWKSDNKALTVKKSYYVPLTQLNFSSIVSTIGAAATAAPASQGLLLTTYGSGTLAVLQELQQSGLINRFSFIGSTFMYYQPAVALKGNAPKVTDSYSYVYWGAFHNSVNDKFVADYKKAYGSYPSDWSFQSYVAVLAAAKALNEVKTVNMTNLVNALQGMMVNGPTGTFQVGGADSHQFLFPTVVGELGGDPSSPDGVKAYSIDTISGVLSNSIAFKE
jgi:branched-chain amino acid transport system substrate-binding protein